MQEALNFYKDVFGGDITTLNRFEGSPMESDVPADYKSKIMRANFKSPTMKFMAADGRQTQPSGEGNISLSLATKDAAEAQRVFDKLAAGGKVTMPLQDAFWGGKFGMLTDKFGIDWMMSAS